MHLLGGVGEVEVHRERTNQVYCVDDFDTGQEVDKALGRRVVSPQTLGDRTYLFDPV